MFTRYKLAQDAGAYETALEEVKNGRKKGHWMWFIFPQLYGLGQSEKSKYYALYNAEAAENYLRDPLLGSRLREICEAMLGLSTSNPAEIFGYDWIKLGSSMTLFDYVSPNDVFGKVLKKYFSDSRDLRSLSLIRERMTRPLRYIETKSITNNLQEFFKFLDNTGQETMKIIPENDVSRAYRIAIEEDYLVITFVFISMMVSNDYVRRFLDDKIDVVKDALTELKKSSDLNPILSRGLGVKIKAFAGVGGEGYYENGVTIFTPEEYQSI